MIGRQSNVLLNPAVERRVIRVRRHWAVLIVPLLQTIGVVVVAFVVSKLLSVWIGDLWLLQSLLWYTAVAALIRYAGKALEWWVEIIIVTDKRFMVTSGIIETKNSMMPITKVTDMSFMRPVIGQILGYGTLRIESAGQKQDLERPIQLANVAPLVERKVPVDITGRQTTTVYVTYELPRGKVLYPRTGTTIVCTENSGAAQDAHIRHRCELGFHLTCPRRTAHSVDLMALGAQTAA